MIYSRCPGTAQNIRVKTVTRIATTIETQTARPNSRFLTYGSRIVNVRKGVDSDWPKKTRRGSSSYWWEMRKRIAKVNGMKSCRGKSDEWWQRDMNERRLTKKRLDLGCTSRKMREKPTAKPIQRMIRPRMRRTRADMGVRLPNALDRRNLGKASCSMALKQYSFWAWNISGIWASMLSSSWVLGSSWPLRGKVWILKAGGK